MGGLLVVSFEITPVIPKVFKRPIAIISVPKGSAMSCNIVVFTPVWLVKAGFYNTNFSKEFPQVGGGGQQCLIVQIRRSFFIVRMCFCLFACIFPLVLLSTFIVLVLFFITVFILVISVPTLQFLCTCAHIFIRNFHAIEINIVWV